MIPDPLLLLEEHEEGFLSNPLHHRHHRASFAFLLTLQMCLMAEQPLCAEQGVPAGI